MKIPEKIISVFRRGEREQEGAPESKLYYLAKTDVFCDLGPEELREIADAAMMTTCQAGRIFYSPNEHGEVLFILKKATFSFIGCPRGGRFSLSRFRLPGLATQHKTRTVTLPGALILLTGWILRTTTDQREECIYEGFI